jgi:hypothetical protein
MAYKITTTPKGKKKPDDVEDTVYTEEQRRVISVVKNNLASGATKIVIEDGYEMPK